jgi:hypothetical protein
MLHNIMQLDKLEVLCEAEAVPAGVQTARNNKADRNGPEVGLLQPPNLLFRSFMPKKN